MKTIILAGGMQSSINSEYEGIPKPMVEVGGRPLLWHIMKHFSEYGMNEFIICGGYRLDMIKQYFKDYYIYESDITVDLESNEIIIHKKKTEEWKVTIVDTGLSSAPGKRIKLIEDYIDEDTFIVTYGDCLSDINIKNLLKKHRTNKKIATIAMAKPIGRNELLSIGEDGQLNFGKEGSSKVNNSWINANCFIFNKEVFKFIVGNYDLEYQLLISLSEKNEIGTYEHSGYWRAVETKRDLIAVEELWRTKKAPWIHNEF